jgi:hypothetical protein
VTFVCCGFWFAVLFQFFYYRFLHPSDHVRLNTKQNISSIVHIRALTRFDRIKKSKSCEEMIGQNDLQNFNENNELMETTSLQFDTSIDERWHNRFAKENRQKLISQQQAIDQKVKLTRLEEATKRRQKSGHGFLTKISTTLKQPTSLVTESLDKTNIDHHQDDGENEHFVTPSVAYISDKRPSQYQQRSKMYNIHEDTHSLDENQLTHTNNVNIEGGEEMILTATKLTSNIIPSSFSSSAISNKMPLSTTNAPLC